MTLSVPVPLQALTGHRAHFLATLWVITRKDNEQFRFTTHDTIVEFDDGAGVQEFQPAGAWNATASRREEGLKDQEVENGGAITADEITYADLEAGLFREAEIVEYQVDPRFPWAGAFYTFRYWITDTTYNGETWEAQLMGATSWLSHKSGRLHTRDCSTDLFSDRCGVLKTQETWFEVAGVRPEPGSFDADEPQRIFGLVFSDVPSSGPEEDEYKHGSLTWTTGANAGLVSEIKEYGHTSTGGQRDVELYLPTPYPITDSDEATLLTGCSRLLSVCDTKFDNVANFRGFPTMPGTDDVLSVPEAPK